MSFGGLDAALGARMGERDLCTPQHTATRLRDFNSEQNRRASGTSKTLISPTPGRSVKLLARASSFGPFLSRSPKLTPRRPHARRRRPISSPPPAPNFLDDSPRVRPFLRGTPQSCYVPRPIGLWSPSSSPKSYRIPSAFKVYEDDTATPKLDTPLALHRLLNSIESKQEDPPTSQRMVDSARPQRAEQATGDVATNDGENMKAAEEHRPFDFTLPQATRPDTRPSELARIRYPPIGIIGSPSVEDTIGSPAALNDKLRAKLYPFWSDLRRTPNHSSIRPSLTSDLDLAFIGLESPVLSPVIVSSAPKERSSNPKAPCTIMPSSCPAVEVRLLLCDRCGVGISKQYADAEINTSPRSLERAAALSAVPPPLAEQASSMREIGTQSSPQEQEREECCGGGVARINSPMEEESDDSTSSSMMLALPFARAGGPSRMSPAGINKSATSGKSALRRDIFSSPAAIELRSVSRADHVRQNLFAPTSSAQPSNFGHLFPKWPQRSLSPEASLSEKRDTELNGQRRLDGLDWAAVGNAYPLPEPLRAPSSQSSSSPGEPESSPSGQSRLDGLDVAAVDNAYPLPEPLRASSSELSLSSETDKPTADSTEPSASEIFSPIIPLSVRDTVECFELKPDWLRRGWVRRDELRPPPNSARPSSSVHPTSPTKHCAKVLAAMGMDLPQRPHALTPSSACDANVKSSADDAVRLEFARQGWVSTSERGSPPPKRTRCEPPPSPIRSYAQRELDMAHITTLSNERPCGSNEQTKGTGHARLDIHNTKLRNMRATPRAAMKSKVPTRDALKRAAPPVGAVRSTAWTLESGTSPIIPFAQRIKDTGQSPFGPNELLLASTPPSGLKSMPCDASSNHSGDSAVRAFTHCSRNASASVVQHFVGSPSVHSPAPSAAASDVDDVPRGVDDKNTEHAAAVMQRDCSTMESTQGLMNTTRGDKPIPPPRRLIDLTQSPDIPRAVDMNNTSHLALASDMNNTSHLALASDIMDVVPHTPQSTSDMDMSQSPAAQSTTEINSKGNAKTTVRFPPARSSQSPQGSDMELTDSPPSSTHGTPRLSHEPAASRVSRSADKRASEPLLPSVPRTLAHPARRLGFRFALPQRQRRKSSLSFIRRKSLATGVFRRVGGASSATRPGTRRSSVSMVWRPLTPTTTQERPRRVVIRCKPTIE